MATKIDHEAVRSAWLKNAEAEARLWLEHVDAKQRTIVAAQASERTWTFEFGELLFNVFSYLNWLAHIDLRNSKYVDEPKMIKWLQRVTLWPREVAEAFWWCLRNPTMHLGRTFFFSDYDRKSTSKLKLFADLHPNLQLDPLAFQPDELKPTPPEDGHFAVIDPSDETKLDVHFFFPGVRRKLDDALGSTLRGIEEADKNSLTSLAKLNRKLLPFRVWAGDEGDAFEADAPEAP